jgi:hypothetical protein
MKPHVGRYIYDSMSLNFSENEKCFGKNFLEKIKHILYLITKLNSVALVRERTIPTVPKIVSFMR